MIIVGANFLEEKLRKMFLTMNEMFHEYKKTLTIAETFSLMLLKKNLKIKRKFAPFLSVIN